MLPARGARDVKALQAMLQRLFSPLGPVIEIGQNLNTTVIRSGGRVRTLTHCGGGRDPPTESRG